MGKVLAVLIVASLALQRGVASQTIDTAKVGAAFAATEALIADLDREHGRTAQVNGLAMHYLEWGPAGGVPFVWLHGSASTAYEFRALGPRMAALGYRVIAPSYRGHGRTQVSDYEFTIYHVADDVVALLDSLGIERAVVGGSSKGGFIAAAVYDQYPSRVAGLLLSDGGSWSNQWIFDHHGIEGAKREVAGGGPPNAEGATKLDVFAALAGEGVSRAPLSPPPDRFLEMVANIARRPDGRWQFLPGFSRLMGSAESYVSSATAPSTLPLLQWSQHAMIPVAVFRNLDVPMVIIDPQNADDTLPVTDQNRRLQALHPGLIVHRIYEATGHAAFRERPEWFLRDARVLLDSIRR
jgi:pimeloyl-ACP methyl ester carboxylesterase